MKKIFTTLALLVFSAGVSAQKPVIKAPKRHYINLAYATQQLKFDVYADVAAETLKSDHGVAAEFGSTFFFNGKRPVANMIRFGLDFSYLDLQYASFRINSTDGDDLSVNLDGHFANIGMQIGPSVTITPLNRLHAKAYIHYAPSFAAFSLENFDNIKGGYAGYITGGVQVSYKFMTLGVEMRSATAKLSTVDTDEDSDDVLGPKVSTKITSTRFIFGFRF